MEFIDIEISFLSGFLKGISEIDGDIREKNLNIFKVVNNPLATLEENYFINNEDCVGLNFTYEKISFSDIENLIQDDLLTKPLGQVIDATERKKYLAYRIMDYLEACFSEDVNFTELEVFKAKLIQNDGVIVKYFIIPLGDNALNILIQDPVTLELL